MHFTDRIINGRVMLEGRRFGSPCAARRKIGTHSAAITTIAYRIRIAELGNTTRRNGCSMYRHDPIAMTSDNAAATSITPRDGGSTADTLMKVIIGQCHKYHE